MIEYGSDTLVESKSSLDTLAKRFSPKAAEIRIIWLNENLELPLRSFEIVGWAIPVAVANCCCVELVSDSFVLIILIILV